MAAVHSGLRKVLFMVCVIPVQFCSVLQLVWLAAVHVITLYVLLC
jgi:hypothetical protein